MNAFDVKCQKTHVPELCNAPGIDPINRQQTPSKRKQKSSHSMGAAYVVASQPLHAKTPCIINHRVWRRRSRQTVQTHDRRCVPNAGREDGRQRPHGSIPRRRRRPTLGPRTTYLRDQPIHKGISSPKATVRPSQPSIC